MSHNKNYGSYYQKEGPKREEVPAVEESQTAVQEEAPVEEQKVEEPVKKTFKPLKAFATVIGGKPCKMRFKPNDKSQVINIIPHKAKVIVEKEEDEWWKVTYKGMTGYMMSQFLKKE